MDPSGIVTLLESRLSREPDVVAAWLFGSVARGTEHEGSDVDVATLFETTLAHERLFDLQAELCSLLSREVQIVDARDAPVDLLHRVFRDGILVVERDRGKRVRFEVDARNRYFDMRSILLEYRHGHGRGAA